MFGFHPPQEIHDFVPRFPPNQQSVNFRDIRIVFVLCFRNVCNAYRIPILEQNVVNGLVQPPGGIKMIAYLKPTIILEIYLRRATKNSESIPAVEAYPFPRNPCVLPEKYER